MTKCHQVDNIKNKMILIFSVMFWNRNVIQELSKCKIKKKPPVGMGGVRTGLVKCKFCGWQEEEKKKREVKRVEDVHVRMKEK